MTTTNPTTAGPATAATRASFLDGFAALHQAMRRDARRLPIAIGATVTTDDAAAVARWYAAFHSAIDHHHRREDDVVWPELVRRDATFADHVEELVADHHALDAALDDVDEALRDLAAGRTRTRGAAVAAADALCVILHDHLDREEAAAFDRIGRAFTAEEYRDLERQMVKGMSLADLAFVGPWSFDGLDEHTVVEMLAPLPAPVRLLLRTVCTRRYRRIAAPVRAVVS